MISISSALVDDKQIIQQLSEAKSEIAALHFVKKYQSFVYSTAFRFIQNHDDAEDIAQEVFIKAVNKLNEFRGESSLKTWLYRITHNQSISFLRKKRIKSFLRFDKSNDIEVFDISDNMPLPDKRIENKEFNESFLNNLNKLPEKQRETFALRYFDDLSYEEISKLLNVSVGGLKANYFHAVQKLSRLLDGEFK